MCDSEKNKGNSCTDLVTELNTEMGKLIDLCKRLADTTGEKVDITITAIPDHMARFNVRRSRGVRR